MPQCHDVALLLGIAGSWVAVAQMARAAEERNELLQHCTIVHLMTLTNATAWILLAVPYMLQRAKESPNAAGEATPNDASFFSLPRFIKTDTFGIQDTLRFLIVAFGTNYCYIGALHFLPASLNTAVFSTTPVFTFLLSYAWLPGTRSGGGGGAAGDHRAEEDPPLSQQALSVLTCLIAVVLIVEPWRNSGTAAAAAEADLSTRLFGVMLSLAAALGTAIYQVYFKMVFGDRMRPDEVGLFLSYMGLTIFIFFGCILAGLIGKGMYALNLSLVPWGLVLTAAISSMVFNFVIKFGLSRESPVTVSLATQIGIPLNLFVDVVVVGAPINLLQMLGGALMLVSFSLATGCVYFPTSPRTGEEQPLLKAPDCAAHDVSAGRYEAEA